MDGAFAFAFPRGLRVIAGTTVIPGDVPCRPEGKEERGLSLMSRGSAAAASTSLFLSQARETATPSRHCLCKSFQRVCMWKLASYRLHKEAHACLD